MSEDASYDLQRALYARMCANADLSALIGDRVYDHVPRDPSGKVKAKFPYVSFGPIIEVPEDADCIDASELTVQLDCWSREPGFREVKRIAGAVRACLHNAPIALGENALVYIVFDSRRDLRDPDGLTSHSVLTFRAGIERP